MHVCPYVYDSENILGINGTAKYEDILAISLFSNDTN